MAEIKENKKKIYYTPQNEKEKKQLVYLIEELAAGDASMKKLEAQTKETKKLLREMTVGDYFKQNDGQAEPVLTLVCEGDKHNAEITFKNQYKPVTEAQLEDLPEIADWTEEKHTVSFSVTDVDTEVKDALMEAITAVLEDYKLPGIQVEAEDAVVMNSNFHMSRISEFDPKENLKIDKELPMTVAVSVKAQ